MSFWQDSAFSDKLLAFICRDKNFLKRCASMLEANDFKTKGEGSEKWIVADLALRYWDKYKHPVGDMLRTEVLDWTRKGSISEKRKQGLLDYVEKINKKELIAVDAIEDKVIAFKQEKLKSEAIQELIERQQNGELSNEAWLEICGDAVKNFSQTQFEVSDFFANKELEKRLLRRGSWRDKRYPLLMIDPLDDRIKAIAPGHIGLAVAPWKRGKSLFLLHIALAYALQNLNGLFFTLEDPKEDVEDRLDAAVTSLPISRLHELPKKVKKRFQRFKSIIRGRVKVVDATEGGLSLKKIEEIWELERNRGFQADFIIIDYDDEISPPKRRDQRREEFADIYRSFRQLCAKRQLLGWIAAQTKRKTEDKKIITGDDLAEDISKIRKVTLALSLGKGEWGDDSIYLYVMAHKMDRSHVGWNIMSDKNRMLIYDREKTLKRMKEERKKK